MWAAVFITAVLAAVVTGHSIKHVVVVMEENRSFDHLFGWASELLGIDGLTGAEWNPVSTFNTSGPRVYVDKNAPYVAPCDPDHSTSATTAKIFGLDEVELKNYSKERMDGFFGFERTKHWHKDGCRTLSMFPPQKLPVFTSLAKSYAIMDKFFCSIPGPTWPNRQFAMAGTSGGNTETFSWSGSHSGRLFPQKTIFDQLEENNMTWANYYVDTPWELFMEKLAKSPENVRPMDSFYHATETGTLPTYSFINPRSAINVTSGEGSNDMHPDHDVRLGEKFVKEIYEAVRASPSWNDTLLIVTFDEHGGFYDHVPPPRPVPAPDNIPSSPDKDFKFDRLGVRIPTILISPWIEAGTVIGEPPVSQRPHTTSRYDLTSIMATMRKVLKMDSPPLTHRDAWAATFEHAVERQTPREHASCPVKLPHVQPVSHARRVAEGKQPINHLQEHIIQNLASLNGLDGADPRAFAKTQAEAGVWMAKHHKKHTARTKRWLRLKAEQKHATKSALPKELMADINAVVTKNAESKAAAKARLEETAELLTNVASGQLGRHQGSSSAQQFAKATAVVAEAKAIYKAKTGKSIFDGPSADAVADSDKAAKGFRLHVAALSKAFIAETAILGGDISFQLNGNKSEPITISTRWARTPKTGSSKREDMAAPSDEQPGDDPYCWTRDAADSTVSLAPCYPSADPKKNFDADQKWIFTPDATIRPADDLKKCVTTKVWKGIHHLFISPCVDSVQQHWGYMGEAPGDLNLGLIMFGNGVYGAAALPAWLGDTAEALAAAGL